MALSEVNAVVNLVVKATSFIAQLQDGWYKGSVELDAIQSKLWVLRARHGQWNEQLQRYGISEDKYILPLVEEATKALENFQQTVEKLQKSLLRRLKKKVFPGQLLYLVDKIFEIVDAGPQLLATSVANSDLLDRYLAQTPASLPFGPDRNYVPIANSILPVRNALENTEGPRVVTVYGGPGIGKSSLVKYLAIHYQEEQKRLGMDASFPHGVYYLWCGQDAKNRVQQLQRELLENLGFGSGSATANGSTSTGTDVQEADYTVLSSNKIKLRSRLAEQESLVILDDLWQPEVLQELIVPAKGVKYLVTSQIRDIHLLAEKIQIDRPTLRESSQILANYTDGLPRKGEFPDNIKSIAMDIIGLLEFHPLSLANIGISINRSRATDIKQWDVIKKHIYNHLDESDYSPPAYERPYGLPVSVSMMLMVESLPPEAQRLLFLVALLKGRGLPEPLVKYFYSFIQKKNFVLKFNHHERCLEDKSLLQLAVGGDGTILDIHGLRTHYILDRKKPEVRSIGSQILAASVDQDVAKLVRTGGAEETLVAVLSAMYYDESLKDIAAGTFASHVRLINDGVVPRSLNIETDKLDLESLKHIAAGAFANHVRLINDGVVPRSLNIETDKLDLVESARRKHYEIQDLVWLLNADHEEDNWERQAHESTKKIIIKYVCQGKLEDHSMAHLLRLPQATSAACRALRALYHCHAVDFSEHNVTFSEAYVKTMHTLLDLFHSNLIDERIDVDNAIEERIDVINALLHVLDYESKDYIRKFAAEYEKLFAMKPNNYLSECTTLALRSGWRGRSDWRGRGILTMAEFPGLLESIVAVLVEPENGEFRQEAVCVLSCFCQHRHLATRIAAFPDALNALFKLFLSEGKLPDGFLDGIPDRLSSMVRNSKGYVGALLRNLSHIPENRSKLGAISGIWDGLGGILRKLETYKVLHRREGWKLQAYDAAGILAYLALEEDLRPTIASLPGFREGLLYLQGIEMATEATSTDMMTTYYYSTRALIVLYSKELADPKLSDVPPIGDLEKLFPSDNGNVSKATIHKSYFSLYWTRLLACIEIKSYAEGLKNLDLAHHHADLIREFGSEDLLCQITSLEIQGSFHVCPESPLRDCRIFLQAMLEDYSGALLATNRRVEEYKEPSRDDLADRGVLKRLSGDLQGGLDDLNAATVARYGLSDEWEVLWQRGYVKYLMGDKIGAKDDAESAQRLKLDVDSCIMKAESPWKLRKIPVNYLGLSL